MRLLAFALFLVLSAPAAAQDNANPTEPPNLPIEQGFVDAAAEVCLASVLGAEAVADSAGAMSHLRPATQQTRASHPFGRDENLWELGNRADGQITVRAPDSRTCSVFAIGAPPAVAFEALAQVVLQRGDFTELEIRRQHEGRLQRTFRSADGRVRVELEGFMGGLEAFPNSADLSMAHIGRRR